MLNVFLRRTIFFVFLCGWLIAPVVASDDRQPERVREITLQPNQWRDTSHGVEYCEGVFRSYGGSDAEAKCRVSVGGISGFIGTMRDGKATPLADALVVINGLSLSLHKGNVIRTHEKTAGRLAVTYSIVGVPGTNASMPPAGGLEKKPSVEKRGEEVPGFIYLLAILFIVGFATLTLAYPLFGLLSLGSGLVIVVAGLAIGGTSNLSVVLIGTCCLLCWAVIYVFCHLRNKAERARQAEFIAMYRSSMGYRSDVPSLPPAPVPSVGEILSAERGTEAVVIGQSPVNQELDLDPASKLPPGRRRIVLD
ncbi:TPA: hypothetical protein L4559_006460 [Pseudomonas aeruginosa]|nr:hypothetical protein [Pseudomonas aeruginosa]